MTDGPRFDKCEIDLTDRGSQIVHSSVCTPGNMTEEEADIPITFSKQLFLADIKHEWQVGYNFPPDTPILPSYITRTIVGIILTYSKYTIKSNGEYQYILDLLKQSVTSFVKSEWGLSKQDIISFKPYLVTSGFQVLASNYIQQNCLPLHKISYFQIR